MSQNEATKPGLNVLCLDGGGVRGLSSLLLLEETMKRVQKLEGLETTPEPHEYFDVIAGTGTGAVQACMLGRLRMPLRSAIDAHIKLVKEVFSDRKLFRPAGSGAFKTTKLKETIKRIVYDVTKNSEELIMERQPETNACKTMIFAMSKHNMNAGLPIIFRSYRAHTNEGPNCTIWEAVCATMAHPDLFKSFTLDGPHLKQSFVDAGLGCNNPLAHVLSEVKFACPESHVASIISIGTGHSRTIQIPDHGPLHRFMPTNVIVAMKNIATDSERVAQEMAMRFNKTGGVYFRINVDQGMQSVGMGDWERLDEVAEHTQAYMRQFETNQKIDKAAQAIKERKPSTSTAHIDGEIQSSSKQVIAMPRCPAPTPVFTGREDKLSQIEACISGGDQERRVCVVHGLGGAGKTQVVLKVVERTHDRWSEIIYVDASSQKSITGTLSAIAASKKIGETHEDTIAWLEASRRPWLLVFDSVDDPSFSLQPYLPQRNHGSILITTRLRDVASLAQGPDSDCNISSMSPEDAYALLLKVARIHDELLPAQERVAAISLLKDFDHLALAVVHAGGFLRQSPHITIEQYRKQFLARRQRTLDAYSRLPPAVKLDDYAKTVYTTWLMCYELLGPQARELLWLIAFLHFDGITEQIFEHAATQIQSYEPTFPPTELESDALPRVQRFLSGFMGPDQDWDCVLFAETMGEISSRSLLEYDMVNRAYRVHTLVQDWIRTVIPYSLDLALECARTLLAIYIGGEGWLDSVRSQLQQLAHLEKARETSPGEMSANHANRFAQVYRYAGRWKGLEALDMRVVEASRLALGDEHPNTLTSMNHLANTYSYLGRRHEAEVLHVEVLAIQKRVLGERHPETLRSMSNLALTFSYLGRRHEAEILQVQVLDLQKQVLGGEHPETLTGMNNLANTYSERGRWHESEALQAQVLDLQKRVLGEEHRETLKSMNNLASTYSYLGRWNEAEALQVQVLDLQKRVLGDEHPETLTNMNNLATTYLRLGRWNEAETLQAQVLNLQKRVLGDEHPETLRSISNLALTYSENGQWDKAETLQAQALHLQKRVLGDEHPETLTSMNNLALTYSRLGRWNEAEALQVQVLDLQKRVLGKEHPETLRSMSNLALTFSYLGRWDEAETLQFQVLDLQKRVLGKEHPETLTNMNNLAMTYSLLGRRHEAEALQAQVLGLQKRVLGDEHPETLRSMGNLASTYLYLGRWNEAEALQAQVLDLQKQVLGEGHPETLTSMNNLANTYSRLGRWNEAETLQAQVLDLQKRVLGNEHPETLRSMGNLASTYLYLGRWNEAEVLQVQVLNLQKRVLGDEHPETLTSMNNLAMTYSRLGRWNEAETLQVQVLDLQKRVLGKEHPETLMSMNNLASTYSDLGRPHEAEALQVQVLDLQKRVLGDEHPETLASINNLAQIYSDLDQWDEAERLQTQALGGFGRTLGELHPHTVTARSLLDQIRRNNPSKPMPAETD